jgi:hypothetical protein
MSLTPLKNRSLILAAMLLTCPFAYVLGSSLAQYHLRLQVDTIPSNAVPREPRIAGLTVAAADLDFGEVWEAEEFAWPLPIRNETSKDIKIVDFFKSCTCFEVNPRSLTVPAHQTKTVQLTLDLTNRSEAETGLQSRLFLNEITPQLEKGKFPHEPGWQLHGLVRSRITLDNLAVHFGEAPVHGQASVPYRVLAKVHVATEKLEITVHPDLALVQVRRRDDDPSQFEISVAPRSDLPVGRFEGRVKIDLLTPSGDRLSGISLPIEGQVQSEIRPLPARLLLGSGALGKSLEGFVVLQVPSGMEMVVKQIETESADVQVEWVTMNGSPDGRTFRITQQISKEGDQSSIVHFTVSNGNSRIKVPTEVCYRGCAKSIPPHVIPDARSHP